MPVITVTSDKELIKLLPPNKAAVIDFCAKWCNPCKSAAPGFEAMSTEPKYSNVNFIKVDIENDEGGRIATHFSVKSLPLFVIVKNNETVYRKEGFNGGVFPEIKNVLNNL